MPANSLVFVVDDDRSMRVAVERLLRSSGLKVESFESARKFLEREPADNACCLVLDLQMPELTGLDLQQALRQYVEFMAATVKPDWMSTEEWEDFRIGQEETAPIYQEYLDRYEI